MTVTKRVSDPEAVRRLGEVHIDALRELLHVRRWGYAKFAEDEQNILDHDVDHAYAAARAYGLAERAGDILHYAFRGQPEPVVAGHFWAIAGRILVDIAANVRPSAGDVRGLDHRLYVVDDGTRQGFYMSQLARLLRERVAHYDRMATPDRAALDGLIEHLCSRALAHGLDLDVRELLRAARCEREFADVKRFQDVFRLPAPQAARATHESWARRLGEVHLGMLRALLEVRGEWYDVLSIDDQVHIDGDVDDAYRRCLRLGRGTEIRDAALWHARQAFATQRPPVDCGEWWIVAKTLTTR